MQFKQRFNVPQGWFRTNIVCRLGMCGMYPTGDETHCWGECGACGKVAGVVSREAIRRYMDREAAALTPSSSPLPIRSEIDL